MKSKALLLTIVVLAFCLATLPTASAQNLYASLHGTVTDSSGAVVPNASVTALNTSTNISTKAMTDSKGYFILPQLQVGGPYMVTITASGFKTFAQSGLTLNVNDNRDVDAKLDIGSSNTTIEVSATALQVETSDTQLKQIVTSEQLEEIPLEGRDPAGLQKLQPGVVESSDRFGNFSTDGSQTPQNAYVVNGIDINDGPLQNEGIQINPDALEEENIVSSTLNPEFARNSGATINQIVKAGTNDFHGSAFEFYRDSFLNSTPYFATALPQFHQNLYGGTFGGPVFRNKLFFFLGYQGLRNRTGSVQVNPTLSLADFAGDFTDDINFVSGVPNSAGLTSNPIPFNIVTSTGTCVANGTTTWAQCFSSGTVQVAPGNWNSLAASITTKYIPQPNQGANYTFNTADSSGSDQGIIRIDYTLTSHDAIWVSSIFQSNPSANTLSFGGGSFPGFGMVSASHFKLFSGSYTHTFNANTLNELRGGYYRLNFPSVEPTVSATPASYGFTGIVTQGTVAPAFPYLSVGQFALGNSYEGPQPRIDSNLTYADNFTKVVGVHSLQFGASYEQFRVSNPFAYLNNGYYYYDGGTGGNGLYSSGDPYLDFELGIPDGYEQTSNGDINALAAEAYAYAQDSWKVSPDVTLNYGIAWDVEYPNKNAQFGGLGINCWTNSTTESTVFPGAPPGLAFPGDPGCNRAGGPTTHYNRFGPRVGFAWSPSSGPAFLVGQSGSHELSIRGGYGLYYNRDQEEQSLQNLEDPPFLLTSQGALDGGLSPSFTQPYTDVAGRGSIPNRFPYAVPTPGDTNIDWQGLYYALGLAAFDPQRYTVPYAQNFNLNIQRALPSNMILQIGYVGSVGHRLAAWYDGDYITPAGHAACAAGATVFGIACNSTTLAASVHTYFPQFTSAPALDPINPYGLPNGTAWYHSVALQTTEGASNYNSLQVSVIKARTHGLYATFSYTYSHALDDGSGYESTTGSSLNGTSGHNRIYTPGFTYLNYGDSDYDARNRFVTSYIYEIPVFSAIRNNAFLRETIAGWEVGGVTALQSGFPLAISEGKDLSLWCDGSSYFGCGDVPVTTNFHLKKINPRKVSSFSINGAPAQSGHFFFDPTSFSDEPIGTYGNVKRNFFHGPGFNYTNLQLSKNFMLFPNHENRYIQIRMEAFNAFNHANFANPGGTFSQPGTFAQVTGIQSNGILNTDPAAARSYQLVGKFFF